MNNYGYYQNILENITTLNSTLLSSEANECWVIYTLISSNFLSMGFLK